MPIEIVRVSLTNAALTLIYVGVIDRNEARYFKPSKHCQASLFEQAWIYLEFAHMVLFEIC